MVNNVIIWVTTMYLIAITIREFFNIICFPSAAQESENFHSLFASIAKSLLHHFFEVSECPIANKYFYDFRELLDQVCGSYSAYGPAIDSDLALYFDLVHQKL